jgi:aspartyl-tRNA(Asn)/glutamyl-tRNA(Gln) amidotransferase subunit A
MGELIDLGVVAAADGLARGDMSARELTEACLDRIRDFDGPHSHDGSPDAINAFVRVYEDDAMAAAAAADELRAAGGDVPPLLGVPISLKDLYEVAGKPITASSKVLADVATADCDVWRRLRQAGMVLLGHLHTHEFAAGGTTDQVGNPWDLSRSAGGSSGGSGAALAARLLPAATGSDTAGSLRIPSACCGTSTIKPTLGYVSTAGVVPLSWSLDHPGPMARSVADCRALLAAMIGPDRGRAESALHSDHGDPGVGSRTLIGARIAVSPRVVSDELDPEVASGFDRAIDALRRQGAAIVEPPAPSVGFDVGGDFINTLATDMYAYHRRFDDQVDQYRPALREWLEFGESVAGTGATYAAMATRRRSMTAAWAAWIDEHDITALIEPTIPAVAPVRGDGYDHLGTDADMISLTHFWNWTGFPVVALPAGLGVSSGLPVSVSLIGPAATDWQLLDLAAELQDDLGTPTWPTLAAPT